MKSIDKTTIFIIGIAMLSIVFVACGSSDDADAPGVCTCSSYQERQL